MPNQNFCGPHDDIHVIDCHPTKTYKNCQPAEKVCRFAYASWCPVCDLDIHRKRSKSECTEVTFRKRGRDNMKKTPTKKTDRNKEYYVENNDFTDTRDKLNSSRVRTNLCELPTTYIAGNCQINVPCNMHDKSLSKQYNGNSDSVEIPRRDNVDSSKSFSSEIASEFSSFINNTAAFIKNDFPKHVNGDNKINKNHRYIHLSAKIDNSTDIDYSGLTTSPNKLINRPFSARTSRDIPIPHIEKNTSKKKYFDDFGDIDFSARLNRVFDREKKLTRHNCCVNCQTNNILLKKDIQMKQSVLDTETTPKEPTKSKQASVIDDKHLMVKIPAPSIPTETPKKLNQEAVSIVEKYHSKESHESPEKDPEVFDLKRQRVRQRSDSDNSNEQNVEKVSEKSKTVKKKPREISPQEIKKKPTIKYSSIKSRHKLNAVKLKKVRSKIAHSVSSDSNFTDSNGSDSNEEETKEDETIKDVQVTTVCNNGATPITIYTNVNQVDPSHEIWPIRQSLFAHVPPYISFAGYDSSPLTLPPGAGRHLKWRLSTITPVIVRKTLQNTGFRLVKNSNDWTGCWGKHMKSVCFQTLTDSQKLNHFPGTFQIGRKDRLWKNLQRLMFKYGQKEFGFIPRTFVLPHELKTLRSVWEKSGQERWIIKPPASARGTGIKVIHRWAHLPKKKSLVVQQYISNPYLINGSKFDLRLYVLVTSFNPLRIYLYPDGLARFASTKYSDDLNSLSDRYMHLTNYSINKLSSQYTANEDANACKGHKWTISKLWEYMETEGINTKLLWNNLQQLVIKTIMSGETSITQLYKANISSRYNCYELFGIDVLLDERLKPWLLEVNISPSLHSASPLDLHVKGPLVETLLNLAQFHLPLKISKIKKSPKCLNVDLYTTQLTTKERMKQISFMEYESRDEYLNEILNDLTGDDVRHLIQAEDELTVIGNFERVFPTKNTHYYLQFMEVRYYNRLFDAWENQYEKNRSEGIKRLQALCDMRVHLMVPPSPISKELQSETATPNVTAMAKPCEDDGNQSAATVKRTQATAGSCNTDAA